MGSTTQYKKPKRIFEDTGSVYPGTAYYVDLENVVSNRNQDLKTLIDCGRYFCIFAPRQSGKTTFFERFCHQLEKDPTYIPILLNFQSFRNIPRQQFYELIKDDLQEQLILLCQITRDRVL